MLKKEYSNSIINSKNITRKHYHHQQQQDHHENTNESTTKQLDNSFTNIKNDNTESNLNENLAYISQISLMTSNNADDLDQNSHDIADRNNQSNNHLTGHSIGDKSFSCVQCGKTFKLKHHLTDHMRIHTGEKPFTCDQCGKLFAYERYLVDHYRIHTGEKPYTCTICSKRFTHRSGLKNHVKTHSKLFYTK